jgi:hypothetical protein
MSTFALILFLQSNPALGNVDFHPRIAVLMAEKLTAGSCAAKLKSMKKLPSLSGKVEIQMEGCFSGGAGGAELVVGRLLNCGQPVPADVGVTYWICGNL